MRGRLKILKKKNNGVRERGSRLPLAHEALRSLCSKWYRDSDAAGECSRRPVGATGASGSARGALITAPVSKLR